MGLFGRPSIEEVAILLIATVLFWVPRLVDAGDGASTSTPIPAVSSDLVAPPTESAGSVDDVVPVTLDPDECDFLDEIDRVRGAVVLVVATDGTSTGQKGTGFHIGEGLYVTAAHVIQDDDGNQLPVVQIASASDGRLLSARVVAAGSFSSDAWERDVAALRAAPLTDTLFWRGPTELDVDRVVRAIGYPWSQVSDGSSGLSAPVVIRGTLTSTATAGGIEIVQSSIHTEEGMSGGPLVDECGTAIAVTSGVPRSMGDLGQVREGLGVYISMGEFEQLQ